MVQNIARFLLVLATLATNSCSSAWNAGKNSEEFYNNLYLGPHTSIKDDTLMTYVHEFIKDFSDIYPPEVLNVDRLYSVRFETLPKTSTIIIFGRCKNWSWEVNEMTISPDLYMARGLLKAVVYHELGHCLLNLDHDQSSDPSFMQARTSKSDSYYTDNWLKELDKFKKYAKSQIK